MVYCYMGEIDFDTGIAMFRQVSRRKLNNQCSDNAHKYVCFRFADARSLIRDQLVTGPVYEEYLDMALLNKSTLVIHVIDREVRAATILAGSMEDKEAIKAWLQSRESSTFHQTLSNRV